MAKQRLDKFISNQLIIPRSVVRTGIRRGKATVNGETVVDLVPEQLRRAGIFPVGRLDKDTTGLLLITDDGAFAHNCISPKKHISKAYIAELDGDITDEIIAEFKNGVTLADGKECAPAILQRISDKTVRIVISEGKYHQIKRMFGTVNLGVNKLHRESIGGLTLPESLKAGNCIEMEKEELWSAIVKDAYVF